MQFIQAIGEGMTSPGTSPEAKQPSLGADSNHIAMRNTYSARNIIFPTRKSTSEENRETELGWIGSSIY